MYKTWSIAKKSNSLYAMMVANAIKFGWQLMKTVPAVAFWNLQTHMVLCWQKFESAINFLADRKKAITYIPPWLSYLS